MSFCALFDRVFAVRHVRGIPLPSFWRSVLMSCVSLLALGAVWVLTKDTLSRHIRFGDPTLFLRDEMTTLALLYGGATILTNWIPDYLSLVQSRLIIGRVEATTSPLVRIPWLVLDAGLTLAIAFGAIWVGGKLLLPFVAPPLTIEVGCFTAQTFGLGAAWDIFVAGITFSTPPATLNYDAAGVYVYSTFFTSVWLWLHLAARFAQHTAAVVFPASRRFATRGFFVFGGFVLSCGVFWSVHFARDSYDVRVEAGTHDARLLIDRLESEGLSVTTRNDATLVVVYEPGPLWSRLGEEVHCGARTRSSITTYSSMGSDDEVVYWAKTTSSLLSRHQVAQCRAQNGLPPLPACPARTRG